MCKLDILPCRIGQREFLCFFCTAGLIPALLSNECEWIFPCWTVIVLWGSLDKWHANQNKLWLDALLYVSQMISFCLSGWILDRMGYKVAESQKDVYFQTNHSEVFRQNDSFIEKCALRFGKWWYRLIIRTPFMIQKLIESVLQYSKKYYHSFVLHLHYV